MAGVIAKLGTLPEREATEAEVDIDGATESLVLWRDGERVDAFLNVCPHAGRRLDWAPGRFLLSRDGHLVCAAHGASFAMPAGECIAGPCRGESLRRVDIRLVGDEVRLAD